MQLPLQYTFEGWKTDKNVVRFGNVFYGDLVADTIRVYNPPSGKPRACEFSYDVNSLRIITRPKQLNPGDTGMVIVQLVSERIGQYGDVFKEVRWIREDGMPGSTMGVTARIVENFQNLSEEERRDAPGIYIPEQKHDFGQVEEGEKVCWEARIENQGKKELIIRNIETSCGCTAVLPDKRVILAGDSGSVAITLNTAGRQGVQHKTISLVTNDWRRSEVMLSIRAEVIRKTDQ